MKAFNQGGLVFCSMLLLVIVAGSAIYANSAKELETAIRKNDLSMIQQLQKKDGKELKNIVQMSFSHYLNLAARFGKVPVLQAIMNLGGTVLSADDLGAALVTSADSDHFAEVMPFLLKKGARADFEYSERTALGQLVLVQAGKNNGAAAAVAALLLEKGADVDWFNDNCETALMIACQRDDYSLAQALLQNGANPDLTGKGTASARNQTPAQSKIRQMLNRIGPKKAAKLSLLDQPYQDDSLKMKLSQLSMAVATNDLDAVRQFLHDGIDANSALDDIGITPLMQAETGAMVKLLLDSGADARKTDLRGWNCLHFAATRKTETLAVVLLIKAGADVSAKNADGETPLLLARLLFTEAIAPDWGKEFLMLLVNAGADIDQTDASGQTLLHCAATNDKSKLAEVCLLLGADPDIKTSYGKTPRQLAKTLKAKEVDQVFSKNQR